MSEASARGRRIRNFEGVAVWLFPANRSKAQTLLLVHGFRGDHHGLMAIAAALKEFNVLIPDLPGYGKSSPLTKAHTIENYAHWLSSFSVAVRDEFGPFHLIAHSFGTQVCSRAIELGLKAKTVTLLNPIVEPASSSRDPIKRLTTFSYWVLGRLGPLGSAILRSWLLVQLMSISLARSKDKLLRREIHKQHQRFFSNYVNDAVMLEGFDSANQGRVQPANLPAGTLLVLGEKDLVAPLSGQLAATSEVDGLRLQIIEEAGHLVHYEFPMRVAEYIREQVTPRRRVQP